MKEINIMILVMIVCLTGCNNATINKEESVSEETPQIETIGDNHLTYAIDFTDNHAAGVPFLFKEIKLIPFGKQVNYEIVYIRDHVEHVIAFNDRGELFKDEAEEYQAEESLDLETFDDLDLEKMKSIKDMLIAAEKRAGSEEIKELKVMKENNQFYLIVVFADKTVTTEAITGKIVKVN